MRAILKLLSWFFFGSPKDLVARCVDCGYNLPFGCDGPLCPDCATMKPGEGYCVRCRQKVKMTDRESGIMKNGRLFIRGKCPGCKIGIYRILPREES